MGDSAGCSHVERRREIYFQTEAETKTKGEQMKIQELQQQFDGVKKKLADIKSQLTATSDERAKIQAAYDEKVIRGEDGAADKLKAKIAEIDELRHRLERRRDHAGTEAAQLQGDLKAAQAQEAWEKYVEDTKAGLSEARDIDEKEQGLIQACQVHVERLRRLNEYCRSVGVQQIGYRLTNLEGQITGSFRNTGPFKHQAYADIFESNIASIERQLQNKSAPAQAEAPSAPTTNAVETQSIKLN
jgi:chromosome segregation ATPase